MATLTAIRNLLKRPGRRMAPCLLLCLSLALAGCKAEIYQGLSEGQANSMLSLLLKYGISAEKQATKTGFTLSVDDKRIVQALEILRENSLPREEFQSLGKVFSAQGMISSATEEQARLAYALSQELSDTFSRIDGVLTARVHVVLGNTDLASGKATPPSVAVFLRHNPDSQATRLVSSIRELAANAVPGLRQDGVSVMLVPVRDTISVPMPAGTAEQGADMRIVYGLGAGAAALLLLSGALGVLLFRQRRKAADQSEAK